MIKNWHKLLTTDCNVIDIENFTVYPIFRTGWTTLISLTKKVYTNKEIAQCKKILYRVAVEENNQDKINLFITKQDYLRKIRIEDYFSFNLNLL